MLDSLRKFANTWIGKIVMGLLLIGLAGFGISNVLIGIGSNTVASVGETDISIREFQREYTSQLNRVAAQTGVVPTNEQAIQFGIPTVVINRLATEAALTELAKRMDLGVSEQRMGELLREDPTFGGVLGQFDRDNFSRALRQNGYTESEYLNALREQGMRQQVSAVAFGGMAAPDAALDIINRYSSDTRSLDFFELSADTLLPPADPTDEELVTYHSDNQDIYRTRPTRTADIIVLSPDALEAGIEVSDEDVASEYERTQANFFTVESRVIKQIILSTETSQDLFEAGQSSGTAFAELVEQSGLPVTDLGSLSKAQVTDANLAEAAFDLAAGAFAIIPAPLGQRAVFVETINPGGQKTLVEATDEIIAKLKSSRARDEFIDVLDQIEELRAAFRPLDEISERYGLSITNVEMTLSGAALSSIEAIPAEAQFRVASPIFSATIGKLAPSIALGANLNVWFDLQEITDARDQTLDEVRDNVITAMLAQRTTVQLEEAALEAVALLESGEPLDNIAIRYNAFPEIASDVPRNGNGNPLLNNVVAAAAFGGPDGHFGSALNGNNTYTIFSVSSVTPAGDDTHEDPREFMQEALRDSAYAAFLTGLLDDLGANIDGETLSNLLAVDVGN